MNTVLALALAAAASTPASAPRKVAVLVGANAAVAGRGELRFAHRDAEELASTLVAVSGFAAADVHVMKDPAPGDVLSALDAHADELKAGNSVVLFYFSGHADPQSLYTGGQQLSLAAVKARLEAAPAALRIGIVDACHGGGWTRAKGLVPVAAETVPVVKLLSSEGSALLASSSGLERAHESDALQGSFFTHHLIAALRGAAEQTPAGEVTLQSAYRYAERHTIRDSVLYAGEAQHPSFELNLRGRTDVILAQVPESGGQLHVEQREGPLKLVHLASGATVLELPAGERRVRLAVEPGTYLLRREEGTGVWARELNVETGKTLEVDEASLTLVGSALLASKAAQEPRHLDVTAAYAAGVAGASQFGQPGVALSAQWRFLPKWGVRARGQYLFGAYLDPANVPSFSNADFVVNHVDCLFAADGVFIPVIAQMGDAGRLEIQISLGTGGAISHTDTYESNGASVTVTLGRPRLTWAPLSASAAIRFYFNDRVALSVEGNYTWVPFFTQSISQTLATVNTGLTVAF